MFKVIYDIKFRNNVLKIIVILSVQKGEETHEYKQLKHDWQLWG